MILKSTTEVWEHICSHGMHVSITKENGVFKKATFPAAGCYTADQWRDIKELATMVVETLDNEQNNLGGIG